LSRRAKLEIVAKPGAEPEMPPRRFEATDKFTLRVPRSVTRELRKLCLRLEYESGTKVTQSDLIRRAINDLFERHGVPPLA
jgi:hypothetical protein